MRHMTARMANPSQRALKKRDPTPKEDFSSRKGGERGVSVARARGTDTSNLSAAQMAEVISPDKPLTEKQKLFVEHWAKGDSLPNACLRDRDPAPPKLNPSESNPLSHDRPTLRTFAVAVPPAARAVVVGTVTEPPTRTVPSTNDNNCTEAGYDAVARDVAVSMLLPMNENWMVGTEALSADSSNPEHTMPVNVIGFDAPPPRGGMPFWIVYDGRGSVNVGVNTCW